MRALLGLRNTQDYSFHANRGKLFVRILQSPGLWMKQQDLERTLADLKKIVGTVTKAPLDYGVLTGRKEFLDRAVITLIYEVKTGEPVAFNALQGLDCQLRGRPTKVYHLGLVMVDPSYRGGGVAWLLYGLTVFILYLQNRFCPIWTSNVTQVPAIVGMFCDSFSSAYPSPDPTARLSFDHLSLARQIMARYRSAFGVGAEAVFDEHRFVIQNAYTGGSDHLKKTFEVCQMHRNGRYNEFCRTQLDYDRGDDVLQLGKLDLSSFFHLMVRMVPRDSLLEAVWRLGFKTVESVLIPIAQWLSPSVAMGDLRPWPPLRRRPSKEDA